MVVGLLSLYVTGLYDFGERLSTRRIVICLLRAFTLGALALCAVYFLIPAVVPGRGVFLIAYLFAVPGLVIWRSLLRALLKSELPERVLIVGTDERPSTRPREPGAPPLGYASSASRRLPQAPGLKLFNPRVIGPPARSRSWRFSTAPTESSSRVRLARPRQLDLAPRVARPPASRCRRGRASTSRSPARSWSRGCANRVLFPTASWSRTAVLFGKRLLDTDGAAASASCSPRRSWCWSARPPPRLARPPVLFRQ